MATLVLLPSRTLKLERLVSSVVGSTEFFLGVHHAQSDVTGTTHSFLGCSLKSNVVRTSHVVGAILVIVRVSMTTFKLGLKSLPDVGKSNVVSASHVVRRLLIVVGLGIIRFV